MLGTLLETSRVPILSNSYPTVAVSNIIILDRHYKLSKISKALDSNVLNLAIVSYNRALIEYAIFMYASI